MATRKLKAMARKVSKKSAGPKVASMKQLPPSKKPTSAPPVLTESPSITASPLVFARHETFHPRYGWIKKGFDTAQESPTAFLGDDAQVSLGVGKNMVRAIRYWCLAFKVLSVSGAKSDHQTGLSPTPFGQMLVADKGFDPYLENLGSLWLLHWRLLQQPCSATAWHYVFGLFSHLEFTPDALLGSMQEWLEKESPTSRIVPASLRKDIHCIIRMYSEAEASADVNEDSIDCPFIELGLIRALSGHKRVYSFNMGAKPGLSADLIAASCLQFAAQASRTATSISLSRLLREPMSPGMCFKLTESVLYEALEEATESDKGLRLSDTAGLLQLSFDGHPEKLAEAFIREHFKIKPARRISA